MFTLKEYKMKKQLLLLFILFTFLPRIGISQTQKLKPHSIVKANKSNFNVEELPYSGGLSVINTHNIYHGRKPKTAPFNITLLYARKEKGSLLKAFTQVFSDNRLKELITTDRGLNLTFYIAPSGKVLEVEFSLPKNTQLTALELEQLENTIKSDVFFRIHPDETKNVDFLGLECRINYQNILDRIEQ
jgi:hypothetical protein